MAGAASRSGTGPARFKSSPEIFRAAGFPLVSLAVYGFWASVMALYLGTTFFCWDF